MMTNSDPTISMLLESVPSSSDEEVLELITSCEQLYDDKVRSITDLASWTPNRLSVIEGLPVLQSKGITIDKAIRTFKELCTEKKWNLDDRLNSRFIVHCKFLK
ncbi:hypothetical protein [Zhongshania marina]|uniref:Uncharacterized protein n=1 Tax=Zhongshania marina TaxID=2304603 RepID=A0A2S4HC87_9GAMM|nr:hypothetical protein [Marortus luteolus]POP51580.1 hypothetical protein C0068_16725 [Marortus luteolus]